MITRTIGVRRVSPVGVGGVHWSVPDAMDSRAVTATIHAALDVGITLIDTAYAYTTIGETCHNETLIAWSLAQHPGGHEVLVTTKGGHYRAGADGFPVDGRPETLRSHCDASLRALGVERIALYQLHHPDPQVPLVESIGALAELRSAGKVEMVGLSNVTVAQLDEAAAITPIASVQNHFSFRDQRDRPMVAACAARGIAYLAYSPLGGSSAAHALADGMPHLAMVAARRGVSVRPSFLTKRNAAPSAAGAAKRGTRRRDRPSSFSGNERFSSNERPASVAGTDESGAIVEAVADVAAVCAIAGVNWCPTTVPSGLRVSTAASGPGWSPRRGVRAGFRWYAVDRPR